MQEHLISFLKNSKVSNQTIESRLTQPVLRITYPKRLIFDKLENYAFDFLKKGIEPRFVSLAGLRGVGKTTLLWQLCESIKNNFNYDLYFFNVNVLCNIGVDLQTALLEFQKSVLKKSFNELKEPIILLFDEVHDDENWAKTLKILYDEARTALIVCTGSSALMLNSTADLSRRMHIEKIYPFSFSELLISLQTIYPENLIITPDKSLSTYLREILFFSESAADVINGLKSKETQLKELVNQKNLDINYTKYNYINFTNFPNLLFFKDEIVMTNSILDLFKRIIHEDIPKLKNCLNESSKIEKLLLRLAGSDEINPEKIAGITGFKKQEIIALFEILTKAEILNVLSPFGGIDTKIFKNRKAFFMSPSLRRALLSNLYGQNIPEQHKSKLLEDLVVMYLKRILQNNIISYSSGDSQKNPDIIIETRDKPIILEIGSSKTSTIQIKNSGIDYRYGILLTDNSKELTLNENCIHLPLNWFLML
jgi:predicted AAA+ superfamily ATPase